MSTIKNGDKLYYIPYKKYDDGFASSQAAYVFVYWNEKNFCFEYKGKIYAIENTETPLSDGLRAGLYDNITNGLYLHGIVYKSKQDYFNFEEINNTISKINSRLFYLNSNKQNLELVQKILNMLEESCAVQK